MHEFSVAKAFMKQEISKSLTTLCLFISIQIYVKRKSKFKTYFIVYDAKYMSYMSLSFHCLWLEYTFYDLHLFSIIITTVQMICYKKLYRFKSACLFFWFLRISLKQLEIMDMLSDISPQNELTNLHTLLMT